uniref:50S ribosomal protein L20 n=1 Tax=Caulerpa lentillifera TaxID=148947 RepID=A0A345HGY7_9CHLO|nr:50S ribosomal protein L20 [Caulerpa lentillifera]AXG75877.1 50S ribosomal protein L20 [Caulerpa lentillifera]QKS32314.1 50S ribosomal protein L20 [Caulerpa lentillifera]QUV75620.1 ribosomal protein L20 [Caulerpa lentillifera]
MTRVRYNLRKRHKKILKQTKGFRGSPSILYRTGNQQLMKALQNGFRSRRLRRRDFRGVWIPRINAKSRQFGMNYNSFISSSKGIINRKILAQLAIYDSEIFSNYKI